MVIGGAGLAGQVGPIELLRPCRGPSLDHILHHGGHEVGITRVDDLNRVLGHLRGLCLLQDIPLLVLDTLDEVRRDTETAIGEGGVTDRHLHRGH